jgi:hypothetical protein
MVIVMAFLLALWVCSETRTSSMSHDIIGGATPVKRNSREFRDVDNFAKSVKPILNTAKAIRVTSQVVNGIKYNILYASQVNFFDV